MAVRFTAHAQTYQAAIAQGSQAAWTVCGWFKISADRNSESTFFCMDSGTNGVMYQTGTSGDNFRLYDDVVGTSITPSRTLSLNTWYFAAVSVSGGSGSLYLRAADTTAFTVDTFSMSARTLARLDLGSNRYLEWLNGCLAGVKAWVGVGLSDDEVAAEASQYLPQRTDGLLGFYSLLGPTDTADYSGRGYTLGFSNGSGATEDGPPLRWARSRSPRATAAPTFATHQGAVTYAGAGALNADTGRTAGVAAAFAGAGQMTATAQKTAAAMVAFAGAGAMASTGVTTRPAAAVFAGQGEMTAAMVRTHSATAAFAGAGAMGANSGQLAAAAFAGSGSMTTATRQVHQAVVAFAGSGAMAVPASSTQRIAATLAGVGQMTIGAARVRPASAAFTGAGAFTADGRRVHPAQVSYIGAGAFNAATIRSRPGNAVFAGAGRMQVTLRSDKPPVNVSLWAVLGSGVLAPLPAFQKLELSRERNGVGAVAVDYPAAGKGFGYLRAGIEQDRPIEVEMWLGGASTGALRAWVTQTEGDDLDNRDVWRFAGTFLESELDDGIVHPQPGVEKGELRFDAKNAGEIVNTILTQAQTRGALTGITRDWTTSLDSSGQAWPTTISGYVVSPKTSLLAVLQDLVEKDFLEFEVTAARVLRVWAPDRRGTDRTLGADPTLFRYGRVSASPVRHSTRDTVTAVLAIGKDGLSATASDATAQARVGRRIEVGVDAGNIDNQGALTAYAQAALASMTKGQEEIRHPLTFGPGDPRPLAGYDVADKVFSERRGGVRRAVDVQQWTLTATQAGITGEVVLNDLIASRLQRLARQVQRITSGGAVIGTSEPMEDDGLAPGSPTSVTASSIAYQDEFQGVTYAAVTVGWSAVTTNTDGSPATDIAGYRVQYAITGVAQVGPEAATLGTLYWLEATPAEGVTGTSFTFGEAPAGTEIAIRVAAFDRAGNFGPWAATIALTTEADNTPPPRPSAPVVGTWFATLDVTWDGLDEFGAVMPRDFSHVEVWISRAGSMTLPTGASEPTEFDPLSVTAQHVANLYTAGTWNQPGIPHGVGWYALLRAVDAAANPSTQSAVAGPATAQKLVQIDLGPNAVGSQQIIDLEVVRAKIADLAVNSAKVESIQAGLVTTGTLVATVTLTGIIKTASSGLRWEGDPLGLRFYNSAGTKTIELRGDVGNMLITGTLQTALSGTRLVMNPGGADPDRIDFFPSGSGNRASITSVTAPADGSAAILIDGGAGSTAGRGRFVAYFSEAAVTYASAQNGFSRTAVSCNNNNIVMWTPQGSNGDVKFWRTNGTNGASLNAQELKITTMSGDGGTCPVVFATGQNAGVKFDSTIVMAVNSGSVFINMKANAFEVTSSEEAKTDITDIRAVLDPLGLIRNARARAYRMTDRVEDPDLDAELRFGPIAEELPATLQRWSPRADGSGMELSTSLSDQLGVIWGALGQKEDQQIVSTSGRAVVSSGIVAAGATIERQVVWDSAPPVAPSGGFVLTTAGVAWQGKVTAWIKTGTVTATGATVMIRNISSGPVVPSVGQPIVAEAVGLGLYSQPYTGAAP